MEVPYKTKNSYHMILQSHSLAYLWQKLIWKNTGTPMFIAALFTIAMKWQQPKCSSIDKWIKNTWYLFNGILFCYKKE